MSKYVSKPEHHRHHRIGGLRIDFTSGSSSKQRRGATQRRRRPGGKEEVGLDREEADLARRIPTAPMEHEQKEEDGCLPKS